MPRNYDYLSYGHALHNFNINVLDHVVEELRTRQSGASINHVITCDNLQEAEDFITWAKAKPLGSKIIHDAPTVEAWAVDDIKSVKISKWQQGVWRFDRAKSHPVFLVTLIYFGVNYEEMTSVKISFLLCHDPKDASDVLADYRLSIAENNRKSLPCILDTSGKRMADFRTMEWKDIFLADNMLEDIQAEVDTFFSSKEEYRQYNLYWRRGLLLTGKPGDGKCVTGDTYIYTSDGMKKIKNLCRNEKVDSFKSMEVDIATESGPQKTSAFYNGGEKECIEIKTKRGFQVEGTLVHPLRVLENGQKAWKCLSEIKVGDAIAVVRGNKVFPKTNASIPGMPTHRNGGDRPPKIKFIQKQMSVELAEWLGWIIGEGTFGRYEKSAGVKFTNANKTAVRRFKRLTELLFGLDVKLSSRIDYNINSSGLRRWLALIGADGLAAEKSVPCCILESNQECQRAFLSAIFEAEACICKGRQVEFSTASEVMSVQIQLMLLNFGIVSSRSFRMMETERWGTRKYWRIIFGSEDAVVFRKEIGFMPRSIKSSKLSKTLRRGWNLNGISAPFVKSRIRHILNDMHQLYIKKNRKFYSIFAIKKDQRLLAKSRASCMLKELQHFSNSPQYMEIEEEINGLIEWDTVESVETIGKKQVFDLTVPDIHSFVANGISCHNTSICRAIASSAKCPTIYCALNTGDVFGLLDNVEKTIALNSPCIAIFEDADSIGSNAYARSRFLNLLDGMCSIDGVLVVATTNSPEKLDAAFTGRPSRFDSLYIVGDPGPREMIKIIRNKLGKLASGITDEQMKALTKKMKGLTASAVQEVAICSLLRSLRDKKKISIQILQDSAAKVKKHIMASKDGKMDESKPATMGFSVEDF